MQDFFKDLKVIELASVLAGPMAGMFFAELGAEVIKVENPKSGGDVTRGWRLPSEDKTRAYSAYYCSINYRKKVIMLDLKLENGKETLASIVKEADILISNYDDEISKKLDVDYASLKLLNPDIIYTQLYAFSKDVKRPGYDVIMQAESGFMSMNGEQGGIPVKMPVALIDVMAAHQMKEAILLALIKKMRTGEGSYISVSLYQCAIASLANQATNYLMEDHIPARMGTTHPNIAPYGDIFETKDGAQLILAIGSDGQFKKLGETLKLKPSVLLTFDTTTQRVNNRQILFDTLQALISDYSFETLSEMFLQKNIPYCKIMSLDEVFSDPLAKNMVLEEVMGDENVSKRVSTIAFSGL